MKSRVVIDEETGEILAYLEEGDRILRAKSEEYLKESEAWSASGFFKGHSAELQKVLPDLTMSEKAVLISIIPYVYYVTCNLRHSNKKDIVLKDIIRICGFSKNTVVAAIDSLISKDILYKGQNSKSNQYFVNPWLIHKGNTINKVLKEMFKNYRVRTKDNLRWKDL